ncbi:ML4 [Symbiodinium sp. CCMP2592]|nr:ML4 [Symbiodinium sp. CCMP2592]
MSSISIMFVPAQFVEDSEKRSEAESTAAHDSDVDTVEDSSSSQVPSPRAETCEEEGECSVVVRGTFIELSDGSLVQHYRRLRRFQTDSVLVEVSPEEAYEPGQLSDAKLQERRSNCTREAERHTVADKGSLHVAPSAQEVAEVPTRTTVMLRNIPNNYTREMFLELLDHHGFAGRYDFAYLPCDFYRDANLGYAFVNLVDSKAVEDLWVAFDGFVGWSLPTSKVCQVRWSGPHQGFEAHVERFRNSPVMHRSVPDQYKPVIFKDGVCKPFPRATKKVKAPTQHYLLRKVVLQQKVEKGLSSVGFKVEQVASTNPKSKKERS